jgi:hypothetical protein
MTGIVKDANISIIQKFGKNGINPPSKYFSLKMII